MRLGEAVDLHVAVLGRPFVVLLHEHGADPAPDCVRLLELSRNHWAIENRLHYVRDVTFNEDRCRVRSGGRALAVIRNLVLHLIRSSGVSVPEARENHREDRAQVIALVTGRIL